VEKKKAEKSKRLLSAYSPPFRVVWSISSASSEAEFVVRHEVVPLVDTLVLSSVSSGVYETSDWVTRSVGSVRI